jgi:HAD superfamily hydrolase (TIGR01509 family)
MAMDEKGLGKRLQAARLAAGFTQQQLCQRANLSYSTLTKIERGAIKSPSIFTIQSLAQALGSGLDELLGITAPDTLSVTNNDDQHGKRASKSGIRFVYFDLNDCLVRLHTTAFIQLAHDSGQSIDVVESVYWKYNDQVNSGELSLDELNTIWAERLGILVDWKKYYLHAVDQMPGVADLVQQVAQEYYVGILSNTMPGFIDALREQGKIPNIGYDAIVDSSQVHAIKPDPQIYETASTMASVAPHEILLIDDTRPNLIAAEKLGWRTVWFDPYEPDVTIAGIRELLEL